MISESWIFPDRKQTYCIGHDEGWYPWSEWWMLQFWQNRMNIARCMWWFCSNVRLKTEGECVFSWLSSTEAYILNASRMIQRRNDRKLGYIQNETGHIFYIHCIIIAADATSSISQLYTWLGIDFSVFTVHWFIFHNAHAAVASSI